MAQAIRRNNVAEVRQRRRRRKSYVRVVVNAGLGVFILVAYAALPYLVAATRDSVDTTITAEQK